MDNSTEMVTGESDQDSDQDSDPDVELTVFIIGVVGVLGNGLVLATLLGNPSVRRKVCNLLVINQSLVDFGSCLLFIMSYGSKAVPKELSGRGGLWLCWMLDSGLIMWNFINMSALNLVGITGERFLMVVHPVFHRNMLTRRRLVGVSVVCWILPLVLNIPQTFPATGIIGGQCIPFAYWTQWKAKAYTLLCFCLYMLFPTCVLVVCYSHMLVVLRRRLKVQVQVPQNSAAQGSNQSSWSNPRQTTPLSTKQMNLTKSMVMISLCFILCISPVNIYFMVATYMPKVGFESTLNRILTYLALTNSCINPFIYAFKYEDLKAGVRRMYCRRAIQQVHNAGLSDISNT